MRKKHRVIFGIFALILVCSPCLPIYAEEIIKPAANESGSEAPDESGMEFAIADSKLDRLLLGTDVSAPDVLDRLHLLKTCSIWPKSPNADWFYVNCDITWDTSTLKTDSVGYQTITGIAVPEKQGFPSWEVTHRVLIYDPEGEPLDEVYMEDPTWEQTLVTAPKGENALYYENTYLNAFLRYINDHREYVTLSIVYDWSGVDLETTGMKNIKYKVDVPDGLWSQKAEGEIKMYLMDPDGFSLGNYRYDNGILTFTWDKPVPDFQKKLKLRVAENEGDWTEYSYGDSKTNEFFVMDEGTLSIYSDRLKMNVMYYFQLSYEEEQSDVAEATFYRDADGSLQMRLQYVEGKRDGDQGTETLPPIEQPGTPGEGQKPDIPKEEDKVIPEESDGEKGEGAESETPKSEIIKSEITKSGAGKSKATERAAAASSVTGITEDAAPTVIEKITQNETIINGVRLGKLMELHKDVVVFEKHGISIYLPITFLQGLHIGDNELFQVSIKKLEDGFSVGLSRDGVLITDITEYQIWLPAEEELIYIGESGTEYPAVKDEKSGMYYLSVTETGDFHQEKNVPDTVSKKSAGIPSISVSEADSARSPGAQAKNYVGLAVGCMVVGLAGAAILYRYIRRSKKIEKSEK